MLTHGSPVQFLAGLATGLAGGMLSGLFGVGGGIVLLPLLRLLVGLDQHQAQGVTLAALLLPSGLPAILYYRRRGIVVLWGLVGVLILGFLPGVWLGAQAAGRIPESPLRYVFVGFLLMVAAWTGWSKGEPIEDPGVSRQAGPVSLWKGCWIGMAGGVFAGMLGIGGGVIMIPLLTRWLRLPQHQAQLTSLAVLLPPIGLPGILVYAQGSHGFPWVVLYGLALGFALGTHLGARLATALSGPRLQGAFVWLMLVTACAMAWKG